MLTLWGRENSINVQKVLWTLVELGMPFERIDAGLEFGVNNTDEFRQMNPNGLVPVIRDGDFVLWESQAIMRYLARQDEAHRLLPADAQQAALVDQWLDWSTGTVWPDMKPVFRNMVRTPRDQWNWPAIEAGLKGLDDDMRILAGTLDARPYVASDDFSLADIPLALIVHRWYLLDIERKNWPSVRDWYERIKERAGFQLYCDKPLS